MTIAFLILISPLLLLSATITGVMFCALIGALYDLFRKRNMRGTEVKHSVNTEPETETWRGFLSGIETFPDKTSQKDG